MEAQAWASVQSPEGEAELLASLGAAPAPPASTPRFVRRLHEALLNELAAPELLPWKQVEEVVVRLRGELGARGARLLAGGGGGGGGQGHDVERSLMMMDLDRVRYALAALTRARLAKVQRFAVYLLAAGESGDMAPEERAFAEKYAKLRRTLLTDTVLSRLRSVAAGGSSSASVPSRQHAGMATSPGGGGGGGGDTAAAWMNDELLPPAGGEEEEEDDDGDDDNAFFSPAASPAAHGGAGGGMDPVMRPNLHCFVVCRVNRDLGEVPTVEEDGTGGGELAFMTRDSVVTAQYGKIRELVLSGDVSLL